MASLKRSQKYPEPLVFDPLDAAEPKLSFIILHGRGSTARRFGPPLLAHPIAISDQDFAANTIPSNLQALGGEFVPTLRTLFPAARFVFPGASTRRATTFKRTPVSQWFDMNPLTAPTENEDWMLEGLRETAEFLHGLIASEARLVGGAQNVVLGGLSQGCAASLIALLLRRTETPIGAFVGMCGWLPFRGKLEPIANGSQGTWCNEELTDEFDDKNPFEETVRTVSNLETCRNGSPEIAVSLLRKELEFRTQDGEPSQRAYQTPVFLGHGANDEKVPVNLGAEAASCLRALGYEVQYNEYPDLGHFYSPELLRDVVRFNSCGPTHSP